MCHRLRGKRQEEEQSETETEMIMAPVVLVSLLTSEQPILNHNYIFSGVATSYSNYSHYDYAHHFNM